jgi:thiol-disulfide isomerase/thioredoxin
MPIRHVAIAVLVTMGLAVAGCGGDGDDGAAPPAATTTPTTTAASAPASASASATATTTVPATLAFTATTVDGRQFDGASAAGKPVVLWFWAAWCPRCRAAAPGVAAVQRDFGGSVTMLGVAGLNSGQSAMRKVVDDWGIGGFTNLADDDGVIWRKFEVTAQEYFVVIDRSGTVVHKGPLGAPELRQRVSALAG